MESWTFEREHDNLMFVVDGVNLGEVTRLQSSKSFGFVKVTTQKERRKLCLEKFSSTEMKAPGTRTKFLQMWKKYVREDGEEEETVRGVSESSADSDEPSFESVKTSTPLTQKTSISEVQDRVLKSYELGIYDVHIDNLVTPHESRATRLIDHQHVGVLTESFRENSCGQIVILVGMLPPSHSLNVDSLKLHEVGSVKIEVLGGNHTREAIQSLYRKGLVAQPTVKVLLYKALPRATALAVGYQHNQISHEKMKTMTLLDKIRLMRSIREEGQTDVEWKDLLTVVFRAKDRRAMQQCHGTNMLVAKLPERMWRKVVSFLEKTTPNDKFFRKMMQIDDNEKIDQCLDVLLSLGQESFRLKINDFINEGCTRGKKKTTTKQQNKAVIDVETVQQVENVQQMSNVLLNPDKLKEHEELQARLEVSEKMYNELKEKYDLLFEENRRLKEHLKPEQDEPDNKRKTHSDSKLPRKTRREALFQKGEIVEACYIDENGETWLEATIKTVLPSGKYKVKYSCDNFEETLEEKHLKRLKPSDGTCNM